MTINLSPDRIASIEEEMDAEGVRGIYDEMVRQGAHPNMAAMLAIQKAPGTWNTDSDFQRKERDRMGSIEEMEMIKIQSLAKRAWIVTTGKTYNGQLGKYNDPLAWVSDTGDVKKAATEKGMEIDGVVKVNAYRGPKPKTRIATDILDRLEKQARSGDKDLDSKCRTSKSARAELRRKLTEKHTKPKNN
jgi:hypothetical protein